MFASSLVEVHAFVIDLVGIAAAPSIALRMGGIGRPTWRAWWVV
jgi:hypothetical protein